MCNNTCRRRLGYTVREAADAGAAAGAARAGLDLLVTDLVMPGETGEAVAARVREAPPGVRVLFVSGYPDVARSLREAARPGDGFLPKPYTPRELGAKVRELLEER